MSEFLRFCIVGFITFLIDYGLLFILTEFFNIKYLLSSGIAFSFAVVVNYILCLNFVFINGRNGYKQIVLFVTTSVLGLLINQLTMWLMVELISMYYLFAKVIATIIVVMWNYISKRRALK